MSFGMSPGMGAPQGGVVGPSGRTGNKIPSGYKSGQLQQFTPEQMQLFQHLFSQIGPDSYLSKLASGDQSQFEQMEAPALRQFNALQGGLSSRFSGMGMGARRSSGFQNTSNQAASDFAQDLQGKRQQLQQQAIRDLMGMGNSLLNQRPYESFMVEQDRPWLELLGQFSSGLGKGIGGSLGGG